MANVFDYLNWRDDLTLKQSEFNEVDAVILARFSYFPFENYEGIINMPLSIAEAGELALENPELLDENAYKEDFELLKRLKDSRRFGHLILNYPVNRLDLETETQFSAVTVQLEPGVNYVAFRGTDDTLVGWKEDFNMVFECPVKSQTLAWNYLEAVGRRTEGEIIVGGHSKGGNLAVYSSAYCSPEIKKRISRVYNFDGPGFSDEVTGFAGYDEICGRVKTYVPQDSIVGMLLEHEEQYTIVHSGGSTGFMQHNIYMWNVGRSTFEYLETVTGSSRFIDATVKAWAAELSPQQREIFVDAVYGIMTNSSARTLNELKENWFESAKAVFKAMRELDDGTRDIIYEGIQALFRSTKEELTEVLRKSAARDKKPEQLKSEKDEDELSRV